MCSTIRRHGFVGIGVVLLNLCVSVEVGFEDIVAKATKVCNTQLLMSPAYQDVELSAPSPEPCLPAYCHCHPP